VAAQLAASQEGLSSMELVSYKEYYSIFRQKINAKLPQQKKTGIKSTT
jgi:hypothetical protein